MSHQLADVYRRRADHLRDLAVRMETTPGMRLHIHAGTDTWHGPRPWACVNDLRRAQEEIRREISDLHARAARFEREADHLDELARAASAAGSATTA